MSPQTQEIPSDQNNDPEEEKRDSDNLSKLVDQTKEKLMQKPKSIDLAQLDEGVEGESRFEEGERHILPGFSNLKVKFHLLADSDIKTLNSRKKYKGLFDIGVLSVHSGGNISPELTQLFKDKARVHCESGDYLIMLNEEQRIQFRTKVFEKAGAAGWTTIRGPPFKHHMLFEVNNPAANEPAEEEGEDSDDSFEL